MNFWSIEQDLLEQGYKIICGVDEAGRGPLAGDMFAAAVVLPFNTDIPGLNDSKKLTEAKRNALYDEIIAKACAYSVATASSAEIDEINILQATYLAMNRAIEGVSTQPGGETPDISMIDGNRNEGIKYHNICVVGGDGKSASIAAASILAKVSRDRYMAQMAIEYPQYGFEKHKGYGTKLHYEKLREHGLSEIHRKTFLKKIS